jgi:RNA polymerase sigma factor (sigma-70 family)
MESHTIDLELIRAAQQGDVEARNELILKHERFVWKMVREALGSRRQRQAEEYFSAGVEGLIRAIEKFDPKKAGSLLTYASIAIKSFVWREMMTDTAVTRTRVRPTKADDLERWEQAGRTCAFAPGVGDAADSVSVESVLADDEMATVVARHVAKLSQLERSVLHLLYHVGMPRDQAGKELGGLSRAKIEQIEAGALKQLRERTMPARGGA